ncbi:MAG: IPT/TIG domain-containing protein [Mediterranea sp.]|jgi:hypothetical protein|nr:IPT/TIG domain-containing protein [Mediterranea sp.]
MKKIYTYLMGLVLTVGMFALAACGESQDELSTEQMGSGNTVLRSYGPSPALRGGTLRFIGTNMDKVTSITLPGVGPITDFVSVSPTEIVINIPQETLPGYPTLQTAQGDIETLTPLSFSEPVTITSITTERVKAGDLFTIEGDYLNLMNTVVFQENAATTELITHTRYKIEVLVPIGARSGVIKVTNGAEIPMEVYSGDMEADVVAPTVTSISELVKPGQEMTVTGTDLDLIEFVVFSTGLTVPVENPGETSFTVVVPADTKLGTNNLAGATVTAYSGIAFTDSFSLVAPVITTITPVADLRPGDVITVTGTDLDLITTIDFTNATGATPASQTETQLTVALLALAQDGDVLFHTASGLSLTESVAIKRPTITSYTPDPVLAGTEVTITGTDFDLVSGVVFVGEGDLTVAVAEENLVDASTIKITVPLVAETGALQLVLKNGMTIDTGFTMTITPATDPAISVMPTTTVSGELITITGKNLNYVEAFYFGTTKVTYFEERSATSVTFEVPQGLDPLAYKIKMVNYEGAEFLSEGIIQVINVLWTGSIGPCDWSGSHVAPIDPSQLVAGSTMGIDFVCDPSQTYWTLRFCAGWWGNLPSAGNGTDWPFDATDTNFEFTLAQADIDLITAQGNVLLFVGNGCIVKRVYVYE